MIPNRRMQGESLFGSREIYHCDIGKLDDCPHSIKPKYSIVLNIRDSDWVCSGKLSKEWNGGGCMLPDMRLAEESTDQLLVPIHAFHVLVNNSHCPWKWSFSWNVYLSFTVRSLLSCSFRGIWSYCVFLSSFQFQESSMFQNIKSGKNRKQKNMVAIKAFDCVAASEVNCSLERGRSLWCPQYGSHRLKLPRTTTQPKGHLLDVLKYLERDAILLF